MTRAEFERMFPEVHSECTNTDCVSCALDELWDLECGVLPEVLDRLDAILYWDLS